MAVARNRDLSTTSLLNAFNHCVSRARGSRLRRLLHNPTRLTLSKGLEQIAKIRPLALEARVFWGQPLLVVFPDPVSIHIWRYGFFEEDVTAAMLRFLKPGLTVVDVGAHLGYFSALAAELVGPTGSVHSFEPTPRTHALLEKNTHMYGNVFANPHGLWSTKGSIAFNDYGPKLFAFNSFFRPRLRGAARNSASYDVEVTTLDVYVEQRALHPHFIKLDAESAELHILKGGARTLSRFRPIVSLEVGDVGVEDAPSSRQLLEYIVEMGYKPFELTAATLTPHRLKEWYEYSNILLLPKEVRAISV
jgi:FkbM family methyltransferase